MPVPTLRAVEIAETTIDWLAAHPEHHDQEVWLEPGRDGWTFMSGLDQLAACGTSCCFAGAYAVHAGQRIEVNTASMSPMIDGEPLPVWVAEELGLPKFHYMPDEAHPFSPRNGLPVLRRWVAFLRYCAEGNLDARIHMEYGENDDDGVPLLAQMSDA